MSRSGRAAVFVAKGRPIEIREFPVPDPGYGEIVLCVSIANICGTDLHVWRGDVDLADFGMTHAMILGHEMTGRVERLGKGASQDSLGKPLQEGDRVVFPYFYPCGHCRSCLRGMPYSCPVAYFYMLRPCEEPPHFFGGFAEFYVVPRNQWIFSVPDGLPDELVAGANCALSQVIFGFERAGLRSGDSVVIQGAGGLGLYATAVARHIGASPIVVLDAIAERLALAREFGADHTINVREASDPEERVRRVKELTDNWGADVVAELVGKPQVVPEGIQMLGPGGRYLEMGNISPRQTYEADPSVLVAGNKSILGVASYAPETLPRALTFLEKNRGKVPLEKLTSRRFPLDEINEAFAAADAFGTNPATLARACVVPSLAL